ncbi:MAG TPA: TetR/AcrR family transcriptional regulator [Nocardioides sp.]|nr:TetR/AcrR family transcriptional regulator [Nocardioides sp.]
MKSDSPRSYRMTARADAVERTGERIIDAMLARFAATPYDRIRLEDVAADAGVSAQTVIRRFGSKHGLLGATIERELARIGADRAAALGEDAETTLRSLVRYYEDYGLLILKVYAEAHQAPGVPELAAAGREFHVRWCHQAFADALAPGLAEADRKRRLAQAVAICDATTWRILRHDGGLSPAETATALVELMTPLLARGTDDREPSPN